MSISEGILVALIGLIGTITVPLIRYIARRHMEIADLQVSNSVAFASLVDSIESLHSEVRDVKDISIHIKAKVS